MRIVYLQGGLGNQLFQYAFARALEYRFGIPVKLEDSFFEGQNKRVFCLDNFNTKYQLSSKAEVEKSLILKSSFLERALNFYSNKNEKNSLCIEKSFLFDDVCFSKKHKTYFRGYWQNEKYFKGIEDIIRMELSIKHPLSEQNSLLIDKIKANRNSVSLHVRRGDYVSESQTNKIHGVCGLDYYIGALDVLKSRLGELNLYIFSDDISWVKDNFEYNCKKIFVDWNDESSNYEDLRLMSLCKHNIIANSSFSWWGAWLNQNPDKIVIAPKQWFADPVKNKQARDIVPDSWIKL